MSENIQQSVYGFADEGTNFDRRHPHWTAVMSRLEQAINLAFSRRQVMDTPIEKFVYFYGNLVAEDFNELFLMAANGYGYGAMKLLRSMYEHTIALKYLHEHPDELQAFVDFDRVQQYKLVKPIIETFGQGALPNETLLDTTQRYNEVKDRFLMKSCKSRTCDEKRVGHNWSKLDFVSMAKATGEIGSLIVHGYYLPLRHAHPTFRAITERLEKTDEHLAFQRQSQPDEADDALMTAHNCLLVALEVQEERFQIPALKSTLRQCVRDWALIWSPKSLKKPEFR